MCGIAGVFLRENIVKNKQGLEQFIDTLFDKIEKRGKHATGFVAVGADENGEQKIVFEKAAVTASDFIKHRDELPPHTKVVLCHTRAWTKGTPDNLLNNHPVVHETCFTTHNGSINNDDALFERLGYPRHGEVDSEIISAVLAHTEWKPEELKKALEKFSGAMAIAALDVERYPGTLLLAKGKFSPLHFLDCGKFIVWASETDAIKEAWAKTLGTPPQTRKYTEAKEGEFFLVTNDGLEKHTFTPGDGWDLPESFGFRPTGRPSGNAGDRTKKPWSIGGDACEVHHPLQLTAGVKPREGLRIPEVPVEWRPRILSAEIRDRVKLMRKAGASIVREKTGTIPHTGYRMCYGCQTLVHVGDFLEYCGAYKCLDCAGAMYSLYRDATKPEKNEPTKDDNKLFSTAQLEKFHTWAEVDDVIHRDTLQELEKITGMQYELLESIVFRIARGDDGAPWPEDFLTAQELIIEEYDRLYLQFWMGNDDDTTTMTSWVSIFDGTDPDEEEGEILDAEYREILRETADEGAADASDPKRCPCGAYINVYADECRACKRQRESNSLNASFFSVEVEEGKCLCCRAKLKTRILGHGLVIGYCGRHNKKCSTQGCTKKPNHVGHDGKLYCHGCSRGKSPVRAFPALEKMGYVVEAA